MYKFKFTNILYFIRVDIEREINFEFKGSYLEFENKINCNLKIKIFYFLKKEKILFNYLFLFLHF